jgi:hypothetical protein
MVMDTLLPTTRIPLSDSAPEKLIVEQLGALVDDPNNTISSQQVQQPGRRHDS